MQENYLIPDFVSDALRDPKQCETEDFRRWIEADENNKQLFCDLKDCREAVCRLQKYNEPDIEKQWETVSKKTVNKNRNTARHRLMPVLRIAAAAAAAVFVIIMWSHYDSKPQQPKTITAVAATDTCRTSGHTIVVMKAQSKLMPITITDSNGNRKVVSSQMLSYTGEDTNVPPCQLTLTTPRGKSIKVLLNDSSEVWLNGESSLTYPSRFTSDTRTVRLSGEAYFNVAHDSRRPFIVEHGNITTRALGTAFNIRSYSDARRHVTLVRGSVMVTDSTSNLKEILKPGEDLAYTADLSKKSISTVDTSEFTSWTEGLFCFDNKELSEIMQVLGRWYNVTVIFNDKKAANYHFSFGADRNASLSETLALLNQIGTVKVRLNPEKRQITVYKR